jgi:hypothetical protein
MHTAAEAPTPSTCRGGLSVCSPAAARARCSVAASPSTGGTVLGWAGSPNGPETGPGAVAPTSDNPETPVVPDRGLPALPAYEHTSKREQTEGLFPFARCSYCTPWAGCAGRGPDPRRARCTGTLGRSEAIGPWAGHRSNFPQDIPCPATSTVGWRRRLRCGTPRRSWPTSPDRRVGDPAGPATTSASTETHGQPIEAGHRAQRHRRGGLGS